jgi:Tol biopolymer transport system component
MRPALPTTRQTSRHRATLTFAVALVVVPAASCKSGDDGGPATSTTSPTTVSPVSVPPTSTTAAASPTSTSTSADHGWIAYQATAGLSLVRNDGTDAHTIISRTSSNPHHPDWAPDGGRLAYTTDEADGTSDIWIADRAGANQRRLVDCQPPCVYADDPAWSPDGTKIAYWTNDDDRSSSSQVIRIADVATGAIALEIGAADLEGPVGPRWSPDGRRLVVEIGRYAAEGDSFREVASAIGLIDLTVAEPRIREIPTPDLPFPGYPDWSPAGDRIVFEAGNADIEAHVGTPPNLYTVRPDGGDLTQITHRKPEEPWIWMPTWTTLASHPILVTMNDGSHLTLARLSEDGRDLIDLVGQNGTPIVGAHARLNPDQSSEPRPLLLVQSDLGAGNGIFLLDGDGETVRQLSGDGGTLKHPDWSPDGRTVVFVDDDDGSLWTVNVDGSDSRQLLECDDGCLEFDYPAFSPDGNQIAYTRFEPPTGDGPPAASSIRVLDLTTMVSSDVVASELPELVDVARWGPDGQQLVIGIDVFGAEGNEVGSTIAVVAFSGREPRRLLDVDTFAYYPDWSWANGRIVYGTETLQYRAADATGGETWNLWTISPEGGTPAQVTDVAAGTRLWQPSWAPSGAGMYATLDETGHRVAVYVDAGSGAVTRISKALATHPRLQPSPTGHP